MAKRNSQLTELLIVAQDDYLTIVDTSAGQSKRVSVKNLTGLPDLGWTATGESWSYSSFSSTTRIGVITVPTDATTKYSIGMKVRFSQSTGGTKFGFIIAVTATTLSVFFSQSITFNNEAISSPVYSVEYMPIGYTGPILTREAYQSDTTNTERWIYSVTGWGVITGSNSPIASETVTLPLTFASLPVPMAVFGGDNASGTLTFGAGSIAVRANVACITTSVTTSNFFVRIQTVDASTWSTGNSVFYHWQAKGAVS